MNGIEISEKFYNDYRDNLFSGELSDCEKYCAVCFFGQGSECFGYDDEFSRDHDFEAGFQLLLPSFAYEKYGMALQIAYNLLPKEYMGLKRESVSACGSGRHGVFMTGAYFKMLTGFESVPGDLDEWRCIPEYALANAVNGKVFYDEYGEVTHIRNELKKGYPHDVKLKKLASRLVSASQYGQYNFMRSVTRGDFGAAALSLNGFVQSITSVIYLLNNSFMPYYKWCFKGLDELGVLGDMKIPLEFLLTEETSEKTAELKKDIIEDICAAVIKELQNEHLTNSNRDYLEPHAFSVNEKIASQKIKALHIMAE